MHTSNLRKYEDVPFWRREPGAPIFLLCVLFAPAALALCAIVLTGDIYKNAYDQSGSLIKWGPGNKIAAVMILAIQIFVTWFYFKH